MPSRRFAPTPIETTSRSSKQETPQSQDEAPSSKHRFAPEPSETTSRSSRDGSGPETGDLQKLKQEHKARRFAPQPVETTTRSSNDKENKPKVRRFAPDPIETTRKSSKDKPEEKKPSRFTPQLVETVYSSTADRKTEDKPKRKFAPVLIDTATRTRRSGDSITTNDASRTEHGHGLAAREHRRHITGIATPMELDEPQPAVHLDLSAISEQAAMRPISPFDGSSLVRAHSQQRQHSFRCPDLDTIDSSESDRESDTSSSTGEPISGSPITASDSSFNEYKHATRRRESVDGFSNYFLQLEAKRAEKRLRDQALAAFPNSDFHEPVQHYVDMERDSDSDVSIDYRPVTYDEEEEDVASSRIARRDSTKVPWEQLELQRHAENLEQERKANQITAKQASGGPWWRPEYEIAPDREMRSMRDRARPPMLGGDIDFPRCRSPEPTRFDVTQGAAILRDQMRAEREASESRKSVDGATLWNDLSKSGSSSSGSSGSSAGPALWGGFCTESKKKPFGGLEAPVMPTGLVTPRSESRDPFDQSFAFPHSIEMSTVAVQPPPTPEDMPPSQPHSINAILVTEHELEQTIDTEYPDSFVTQVYNYLSLGYPSLARPFDEELGKIAHIPLTELRADDEKARATPRGYIRLGADFEGGGGVEREESCMRWVALKRYVHEWARQEKNMSKAGGVGADLSVPARRGSWGN